MGRMLEADPKIDPLVEILRLAYRRGLVIRQEQEHSTEQASQKTALPTDSEEQIGKAHENLPFDEEQK